MKMIILLMLVEELSAFIHLLLNQKNINLLELAISLELIMLNYPEQIQP